MPYLAVIAIAFALTFLAELPDKSMFASLVLGTRYRPSWVWAGAASAFTLHMAIAVTAGQLLALLPDQVVKAVVAALFVARAPRSRGRGTPGCPRRVVLAGRRDELHRGVPRRVGGHHPGDRREPGRQV
jgi:hypothetical protein